MTAIELDLAYDPETSTPLVFVGPKLFRSMDQLIAAHRSLVDEGEVAAVALARAYNHFARGGDYEVISDPAAFQSDYRATAAAENPQAAWSQAKSRLSDFGMPEFERIHAPFLAGENIAFFARDTLTGLAYEVGGALERPAAATYEPVRLAAMRA